MSCPRCHHPSSEQDVSCVRCGAPLLIGDDPAPGLLDQVLDLDRRARSVQPLVLEPGSRTVSPPTPFAVSLSNRDPEVEDEEPLTLATVGDPVPVARRLAAAALDAALMASVAAGPVALAVRALPAGRGFETLFPACAAFLALLGFTYEVLGHALMGATLGKLLLGLRVTGPGGSAPGLARSAARAAVAVVGAAGLGIGMLVGLFSRDGRSLHDLVAGTSVVRAASAVPPGV